MFPGVLIIVLCLLLTWRRWRMRNMVKLANELISEIPSLPLLGYAHVLIGDAEYKMELLKFIGDEAIRKGGMVAGWLMDKLYICIADPEIAACTLNSCLQKDRISKMLQIFSGNGHIFAPVPIWRPRRKIVAPTFSPRNLKHFMSIFNEKSRVFVDLLHSRVGEGDFSIWNYATNYSMDSVFESTLGVKVGAQMNSEHPFILAIKNFTELTTSRIFQPWLHSDFIYYKTPYCRTLLKHKQYVMDFINKIIENKRKSLLEQKDMKSNPEAYNDGLKSFLDLLIESFGQFEGCTNLELQEETLVIVIAGTDTSAVGISFTTVMLSKHLDEQEKVYQEIIDVFGDSDRPVEAEDLTKLRYLDAFVKESMRLYPPVPIISRNVEQDIKLPTGVTIVKGCGLIIDIWALHRNPKYWGDDADVFRPERFIDSPLKHPAAFMPFSYGPRGCLGYKYAMISMKTALITLLRRYRVCPVAANSYTKLTDVPLRVKFDIMMRHCDNYMVQLELRN